MTVRELILELQKLNPDATVMVPGFDGGFQAADQVHSERLHPSVDDAGGKCYAASATAAGSEEYVVVEPEPDVRP
jgi:hypothetical protein